MTKTFRYRLYPTKTQAVLLHGQIDEACRLYNAALEERKTAYRKCGVSLSCYDQTKEWTQVRHDGNTTLVHYKIGQDVLQRVDRAFDAFFRRVKAGAQPGYPRFKSRRRYDSITYINYGPQPHVTGRAGARPSGLQDVGQKTTDAENPDIGKATINYGKAPQLDKQGKLILKGIGHVTVRWHRPISGTTKTCTIKREAGRWYVSFSVDYEPVRQQTGEFNCLRASTLEKLQAPCAENLINRNETRCCNGSSIGLDVGLDSFATLSDGSTIENPRYGKKALQRIRRAHRRVSRRRPKPGHRASHRYRKSVQMLQRAYVRIKQQRRHFHHVEARKLVNQYGLIAVEDLRINNMSRSAKGTAEQPGSRVRQKAGLNRSILDAGWGMFVLILFAKAAEAARTGVKVPPGGTSQRCVCGASVPKTLKDRWHLCLTCGLSAPRDQVSAMVIKQRALSNLQSAS